MESRNKLTMCRLCLCENKCFINIYEENDWHGYVAAEVISDLLQCQVSETDCYPHVLCSTCLTKLTDFKLFKECCQKSTVTYDKMFIFSDRLVIHQPEMDFGEGGSGLELLEQDPLKDAISDPIIKEEELDIDSSCNESDKRFEVTNAELSFGPILLKHEVLSFNRDIHTQETLIESEVFENADAVEPAAISYEDSTRNDMQPLKLELDDESMCSIEKEQGNETAPEKGVGSSKGRFECYHCNKVYMTKSGLKRHMTIHGFGKPYICEEEKRWKGTSPEKGVGRIYGRFECHCCRKVLMTKCTLIQHMATHEIGNFFRCDVCGKICVSKSKLIIHIRQHTGERPYKCTDCSALFSNNSNLKHHMRIHTNVKPFKCKECNLSFSQNSNLKSHMTIHSNLRPYSCGVCHAAFRRKSELTSHMRTHTGDRPYKCTVCSKAFSQSAHLRNHQVLHTGEKPHPCPHCCKRFSVRKSLQRHLKTVCVEKC